VTDILDQIEAEDPEDEALKPDVSIACGTAVPRGAHRGRLRCAGRGPGRFIPALRMPLHQVLPSF
jgi:hypothetical protein